MKQLKKQLNMLLISALLMASKISAQQMISSTFYGHNYWFTDYTGAPTTNSLITPLTSTVWT